MYDVDPQAALDSVSVLANCTEDEGLSYSIVVDTRDTSNFEESPVYITQWNDEISKIREIRDLLVKGEAYVSNIYTYRSISLVVAQLKVDPSMKTQVRMKTLELIEPEIDKLREFMKFQKGAVATFVESVEYFAKGQKEATVSDRLTLSMIQLVDLLSLLDVLKNMKASMNNDYSYYKRIHGILNTRELSMSDLKEAPTNSLNEQSDLGLFLAMQHSIMKSLKHELSHMFKKIDFQRLLAYFAHKAADWFEEGRYLTPKEKFQLLRTIPCFLYLADLDAEKGSVMNVKYIKLDRFVQLFRRYPIVPLYGDIQTTISNILERSPSYSANFWGIDCDTDKFWSECSVLGSIGAIRRVYQEYHISFAVTVKNVQNYYRARPNVSMRDTDRALAQQVQDLVLRGLALLSDWTGRILWQAAWKYAHPSRSEDCSAAVEYECAVRYNYTAEEKDALVELISAIKSLESTMLCASKDLSQMLRASVYLQLDGFLHEKLPDILSYTEKRCGKFGDTYNETLVLFRLISDWNPGVKKDLECFITACTHSSPNHTTGNPDIHVRCPGLQSKTRAELTLFAVSRLLCKPRKHKLFGNKDLLDSHLKALECFYHQLQLHSYLPQYDCVLRSITDLGELWYREFYLELTNRLQFEIESSLAWNLIDHVLETSPEQSGSIAHLLDIYNDAARRALVLLNQRFLYDEIVSEVNLAFDQLIYKLGRCCFTHHKVKAALKMLDKDYLDRLQLAHLGDKERFQLLPDASFDYIYQQRALQLLGRSIDLNQLIVERTNQMLIKNLDYAISVFESSPITSIVEFELLFENIRLTHQMMRQSGLELDPWDDLVEQANTRHSLDSSHGRILLHILFELVTDLMPNYVFNACLNRFVEGPVFRACEEVPRGSKPPINHVFLYGNRTLNGAFDQISNLTSHFFGPRHVRSICQLVGTDNLLFLVKELIDNMRLQLSNVIKPHISEIIRGMPSDKTGLPQLHYGVDATYEYFRAKTKDIANYPVLGTEVFQHFREWGNGIIFFFLLDSALSCTEDLANIQASPFLQRVKKNQKPPSGSHAPAGARPPADSTTTDFSTLLGNLQPAEAFSSISACLSRAEAIYGDRVDANKHSLFRFTLQELFTMLEPYRTIWGIGAGPVDNSIFPINQTYEFYRIWSALQFVFLIDLPINDYYNKTSLELVGEGFFWAGTSIIYFLGQQFRFRALDFSYHLAHVSNVVPVSTSENNVTNPSYASSLFLLRLNPIFSLNHRISLLLQTNLPLSPSQFQPTHFIPPPESDSDTKLKFLVSAP